MAGSADHPVDALVHDLQPPRQVLVTQRMNVRSAPSTLAARVDGFEPGRTLSVDRVVQGENFLGRSAWYRVAGVDHYFWAAGAQLVEAVAARPAAAGVEPAGVRRRADGTIRPLDEAQLRRIYGDFAFEPRGKKGAVAITTAGWLDQNLVEFDHAALHDIVRRPLPVHRLALPHFARAFDGVVAAGLDDLILTCDGSFVARFKNWNPASGQLSSHSWGVAIDLNSRWNRGGDDPALPGETGTLRELVHCFTAQGFAWGGHFSSNVDGMHFELAIDNP